MGVENAARHDARGQDATQWGTMHTVSSSTPRECLPSKSFESASFSTCVSRGALDDEADTVSLPVPPSDFVAVTVHANIRGG